MYHGTRMTGNRRATSCLRPASRISTGGSPGAGGFKDQSSPPWHAALLDFRLPSGLSMGLAVGNRVRQGENGLRHMEQGIDHQRVGIGRFGQANLGRAKLSHALGVESAGLAVPADGDPQRERVKAGAKHLASGFDEAFRRVQCGTVEPAHGQRISDRDERGNRLGEIAGDSPQTPPPNGAPDDRQARRPPPASAGWRGRTGRVTSCGTGV